MTRAALQNNPTFFQNNRQAFQNAMEKQSAALFFSANDAIRNHDQIHLWRQDSNFYYLTGIEEKNCALLLIPDNTAQAKEILFIPEYNAEVAKWDGVFLDQKKATSISGVDQIMPIEILDTVLNRVLQWRSYLYCDYFDQFYQKALTLNHKKILDLKTQHLGIQFLKSNAILSQLRAPKDEYEIDLIKQSIQIIHQALINVSQTIKTGCYEYELEAELIYHYLKSGCKRTSFDPIVASGKNATILHYTQQQSALADDDLVLVDTGAEWGMYTGDITRVFPVAKRFNERQRKCYQSVLDVQKSVIAELKANMTWDEIYQRASQIQGELLKKHGFIDHPQEHQKITLHRIGHSLGLDTHDPFPTDQKLPVGAVITIEPGLYLPNEKIGIRIEDNLMLTENGCINLSQAIPKEIDEIEALMQQNN